MDNNSIYCKNVLNRSTLRFILGLIPRFKKNVYYSYCRRIARNKGAFIGKNVIINIKFARSCNANVYIDDNCSIQTSKIDTRASLKIGKNVIIGENVQIITCSHNIDSPNWEFKAYGLEIFDYAWLATSTLIVPSCRKIGYGAVCGAGSVVIKDVDELSVVGGNPAMHIKYRKVVHKDLVVESLLAGDFNTYRKIRKSR